jgi:four helix bundle protein
MSGYRDLEIYRIAFDLSVRIHRESLKLPAFELYEQGGQIRRSSKSVKDTIAEGFGRRIYKPEYIKFLTYSIASCDETINHLLSIVELYPDMNCFSKFIPEYEKLGKMINSYLKYVKSNWK